MWTCRSQTLPLLLHVLLFKPKQMKWMPESLCCRRGWGFIPWAVARDCRGDFSHCWWNGWWQHLHTTTSSCRLPPQELWPWEGEWCWHWLPHFHCLPVVSLHAFENRPWQSASETLRNMLFYEILVSNNFQQLFGIFFLSSSLSCTSSPPFQRGCVTCRNVELKGPEFLQQEFVLEASESEGEETGSPPRASAGLSHPFSKLQPGQLMSWGRACFQWG